MPAHASHHTKQQLRATALAARDALSDEQRSAAAQAVAARGLPFELAQGAVVSGYSPIRSEIDPMPLMRRLASQGARLALPTVTARGHSLIFRAWSVNDRLLLGSLGIPEPSPAAAEVVPDVMLVPLAAFDRAGHRIGYGAGYYDFTFSHLRNRTQASARSSSASRAARPALTRSIVAICSPSARRSAPAALTPALLQRADHRLEECAARTHEDHDVAGRLFGATRRSGGRASAPMNLAKASP